MPARSFAAPTGRRRRTAVAELTPQDMAAKLLATGFERSGPSAATLSDPIADTPMVVTLDQLRPYDHDPRVTRNPAYAEIKASIRERGLDAPPAITRRPGEAHYIIRNGGNTRLAILRELWSETKEERFFRIACLFRPWPARGEIVALTGHLAENELRGGLTFIERALGIEKAREFYEQESGQALSQSELARRLTADGYPVPQSHISRMNDAVRYLLPAIPTLLYGGLGRHQVDRLAVLRKACERTWERRALGRTVAVDFATLFQDVLTQFDTQPDDFSPQRVQDELVGQMAELLEADYDTLALEINDSESRQRALTSEPAADATGSACRACWSSPAGLRASAATRLVCAARHHAGRAFGASSDTACTARSAGGPARATRRAPARAHRDTGTDHRAPAVHPADGRGPARRQAARLRGRCAACDPRAGRRALSHLGRLVHRAGAGRAGSPARAHRAVRARDRRGSGGRRPHRGQRRRHRLRLRGAGRGPGEGAAGVRAGGADPAACAECALRPPRTDWTARGWPTSWRRCCMATAARPHA
jgi:ParB family protein of integrating conjugative element (PFGI_1 class)